MLGFQAGVSYSAEETREMMMQSWKKAGSQFAGATDKLALTWSGMLSMLGDKWFAFRSIVMKSGLFDFLKSGLSTLNKFLDDAFASGQIKVWAKDMSDWAIDTIGNMITGVGWLIDAWNGLKMVWVSLKIGFLEFSGIVWTGLIKLREAANSMWDAILGDTGAGKRIKDEQNMLLLEQKAILSLITKEAENSKKELNDLAGGYELASDKAKNFINEVKAGAEAFKSGGALPAVREEIQETTEDLKSLKKAEDAWLKSAQKVWNDTMTSQERYNEEMEKLDTLVMDGLISWEVWSRAVTEAQDELDKLSGKGEDFAQNVNNAVTGWASDFSSTLNDLVWEGNASFDELLRGFMKMITQMVIQSAVVKPLLSSFGFAFADGGVLSHGRVQAFARGGVVDSPTVFPMAKGAGLMGEAGPEAIMPLHRGSDGSLGVKAQGSGSQVTVNIINNSSADISMEESEGPDGMKTLDILVDDIMADKLVGGKSSKALQSVYGLRPALQGR